MAYNWAVATESLKIKEDIDPRIKIRAASSEDIPCIKKLLIDSWVEHARREPELLDENRMRQSNVEEYYQKALNNPDSFVLVAEIDGRFAGFIRGDITEIPNFFKNNRILYLDDCCVEEEFRRKGVATTLLIEMEKIAREKGIKRLQGRVYTFNEPVQELLISLGYSSPHETWNKVIS